MSNRLAAETSPYLLQHAENPVDWYPWGEEALARARAEDKPILLSIGYSACHWCHVMAHESFENADIARMMNDDFVNIKVAREERPDLDAVYMEAVQSITGQGGWPLTVFLTPEGKPFFGGTYFPPEDRQGMPGFPRVLRAASDAYRNRRQEVDQATKQITAALATGPTTGPSLVPLAIDILERAYSSLEKSFDWENGGFGGAPKFPQPLALEFLLRYSRRTRDPNALKMVTLTLEKMAAGGIYDQIGGGFHRYATDRHWLVPHFEKMLYDNAQLSRVYLQAFLVTGRRVFRRIAEETLDYVIRDLTGPEGGFYSTRDADSEGEEGKYYLWTQEEVSDVLEEETASTFDDYYGVTAQGNFEGRNILHVTGELGAELPEPITRARAALLSRRQQRAQPGRDEKAIASWNGLMLTSLAETACALGREDYLEKAVANGSFLCESMMDGLYLKRSWKDGQAKVDGFLEDYAMVIDGLLSLHEATFSGDWLRRAMDMAEVMVQTFWDESKKTLNDTGRRHQSLFLRPRNLYDNAIPSGSSAATMALLKLARITGRADLERIGAEALRSMRETIGRYPLGCGKWLCALDFYLSQPKEVVILGRHTDQATKELMRALYGTWLPNKVVVASESSEAAPLTGLGILEGKRMVDGRPTVYVCERFTCRAPVTTPEAIRNLLGEA